MSTALDLASDIAERDEGFSGPPYLDPVGIPTQAFGAIIDVAGNRVTMHTAPVTRAQGEFMLKRDMLASVAAVRAAVHVPLTVGEEAALDDFVFNLGGGTLLHSTLLRLLNTGDYEGAAAQIALFDHAGGKVMAGLLHRRMEELALFNGTNATAPPQPSASVASDDSQSSVQYVTLVDRAKALLEKYFGSA